MTPGERAELSPREGSLGDFLALGGRGHPGSVQEMSGLPASNRAVTKETGLCPALSRGPKHRKKLSLLDPLGDEVSQTGLC